MITLFKLLNQLACYYTLYNTFQPISVLLQLLFMAKVSITIQD